MLGLKLKSGDTCELTTAEDSQGKRKLAIVWEGSQPGLKDTIVQTSKLLQEAYGFKLGDKIIILRSSQPIDESTRVTLRKLDGGVLNEDDVRFWARTVAATIPQAGDYLVVSQKIRGNNATEFVVKDVGVQDAMIAWVTPDASFHIVNNDAPEHAAPIVFEPTGLGGLREQIDELQKIISRLLRPVVRQFWRLYEPVHGVLLYGAKGTGKTAMIEALTESGWPSIIHWKPGTKIRPTNEPCLIIVPSGYILQKVGGVSSTSYELEAMFKQLKGSNTLVVAEARHPNDIDQALRTEGKFAIEIELPIPSVVQRKEILLALRGSDNIVPDELVQQMSERTHGYVGVDLSRLLRETLELASERSPPCDARDNEPTSPIVQVTDLERVLEKMHPSALQEIFLETPNVRWREIGGQHEIKRQLHNAVERPLKFADRMKKLGLKPKKGILLYGPPGCSKTLLVRALATEAGLNFLAVKGAELISMYVGESERATREVFRKAKAASPCIIFFDEIDAIAFRGRSGSDLNVLTTLLNEMDGFEELRNVFVVAATNKPQVIDPALMRPGRFDNVVYIGPPDQDARREILQKQLQRLYDCRTGLDADMEDFVSTTEGFSGAEVVAVCQTAGEIAFDADRETITSDDMRRAVETSPRSITAEMLQEFETWNAARMAR